MVILNIEPPGKMIAQMSHAHPQPSVKGDETRSHSESKFLLHQQQSIMHYGYGLLPLVPVSKLLFDLLRHRFRLAGVVMPPSWPPRVDLMLTFFFFLFE